MAVAMMWCGIQSGNYAHVFTQVETKVEVSVCLIRQFYNFTHWLTQLSGFFFFFAFYVEKLKSK